MAGRINQVRVQGEIRIIASPDGVRILQGTARISPEDYGILRSAAECEYEGMYRDTCGTLKSMKTKIKLAHYSLSSQTVMFVGAGPIKQP